MKQKITLKDIFDRIIWSLVGYFASLYGVVQLPPPGAY